MEHPFARQLLLAVSELASLVPTSGSSLRLLVSILLFCIEYVYHIEGDVCLQPWGYISFSQGIIYV